MDNKTVFRLKKTDNFVIISRHPLENSRLSYEARGLLACMLAKPNDWVFYLNYFIKNSPAGRDKVRRIFNELENFGYLVKTEQRGRCGQFSSPEYVIHESPVLDDSNHRSDENLPKPENPPTVKPSTVIPSSANLPLLKKHLKPNKQVTKDTPTKHGDFIWSEKLGSNHQQSIFDLFYGVVVDHNEIQLLLDELVGQIENIKNPVGYFRSLLHSHLLGEFVPAKALQIQAGRNQKTQNEMAVERSREYHNDKIKKEMEKYLQQVKK